jgi:hypothetical protein
MRKYLKNLISAPIIWIQLPRKFIFQNKSKTFLFGKFGGIVVAVERISKIYGDYESDGFTPALSEIAVIHPELNSEDFLGWIESKYAGNRQSNPKERLRVASGVASFYLDILYALNRRGEVKRSSQLRTGYEEFRQKENLPIWNSRIQELRAHTDSPRFPVTAVTVLTNIPDLTNGELLDEASRSLKIQEVQENTNMYREKQLKFVNSFLREALTDVRSKPNALRLMGEFGLSEETQTGNMEPTGAYF